MVLIKNVKVYAPNVTLDELIQIASKMRAGALLRKGTYEK